MQTKIASFIIGLAVYTLTQALPQTYNGYPLRPTFVDLDPNNNYYTTAPPYTYSQNSIRIWPFIIDQAVSPLYNWNWGGGGYGYNTGTGTGYNPNTGTGYNPYPNTNTGYYPTGYGSNTFSNGYYNAIIGYPTTVNPYLSNNNPFGVYNGKK